MFRYHGHRWRVQGVQTQTLHPAILNVRKSHYHLQLKQTENIQAYYQSLLVDHFPFSFVSVAHHYNEP